MRKRSQSEKFIKTDTAVIAMYITKSLQTSGETDNHIHKLTTDEPPTGVN